MARRLLVLLAPLLLAACADHSLRDLSEAQFTGTPFQQALALEYRQLAEDQEAAYDWKNSQRYAQAGLTAAYGRDVAPPSKTRTPEQAKAREVLMSVLTEANKEAHPKELARAQSQFECWLQHDLEDPKKADTLSCQENFATALAAITAPSVPEVPLTIKDTTEKTCPINEEEMGEEAEEGAAPAKECRPGDVPPPAPEPAPVPPPPPADNSAQLPAQKVQDFYVLFFNLDSSELNKSGKKALEKIARSLKKLGNYHVVLNGHTDRSGPDEYNMKLSERRSLAVKKELLALGLHAKQIDVFAFGETDPKVPTADGVKEPKKPAGGDFYELASVIPAAPSPRRYVC